MTKDEAHIHTIQLSTVAASMVALIDVSRQ